MCDCNKQIQPMGTVTTWMEDNWKYLIAGSLLALAGYLTYEYYKK
jgi:predicted negative regulator of RcsB-dependent stress response